AASDPYDLSSALIMLAAALQISDPNAALATAEEGVQIARDAGISSILSTGLSLLASFLFQEHPDEAIGILDEARQVALLVGDRIAVSQVSSSHSALAIRSGDWDTALRAALDAADQKLALGDLATLPMARSAASVALAHMDAFEASAVLLGVQDKWAD